MRNLQIFFLFGPSDGSLRYAHVLLDGLAQVCRVEVGVDLCRKDILMPQQLLHLTYVGAAFEQVCGEGVAEGVGADVFVDAGALGGLFQDRA